MGLIVVLNEKLCFCKREIMSICTADSESDQKSCTFYKMSSFTDRCMHFMFDEDCDCLEAQIATEQPCNQVIVGYSYIVKDFGSYEFYDHSAAVLNQLFRGQIRNL